MLYLVEEVLTTGARGFVLKVDPPNKLLHAVSGSRPSYAVRFVKDSRLAKCQLCGARLVPEGAVDRWQLRDVQSQ